MKKIDVLGGLLKKLLPSFDMTHFDNRLILQKTIYLLQSFGISVGYEFNWYLYGPYSPGLAKDGFELEKTFSALGDIRFKDNSLEERFNNFSSFVEPFLDNPHQLELLASIHFLCEIDKDKPLEAILKRVEQKQPYFNAEMCRKGYSRLQKAGLIQ